MARGRGRETARASASPLSAVAAIIVAAAFATATFTAPAVSAQDGPSKRTLPNGVRVIVQANDHTATVVVSAMVRVTALHEPRRATGIRRLTQSMLASGEGCRDEMLRAAVRAEGAVAPDYVELSLAAPAESLEEAVRLMRRMIFRPVFSSEMLERVRPGVVRALIARSEVPSTVAIDRLYEAVYPRIRSGDTAAGDPLEIASITLDDIRTFHAAHYLPNATVIAISGGVDAVEATTLVAEEMGRLLPGSVPAEVPEPAPGRPPGVEELEVEGQTAVVTIGGRAVSLEHPSYPAMATGMVLLGSGMDSRLYRALRIERALAYSIGTELTPSATAPSGLIVVTCDPEHLDEVWRVVDDEVTRAMTEPADAVELQRAKRYLIGRHALRSQRNQEVAHYLAMFELLGGAQGYRRDAQLVGEIAAVDAGAVSEALRDLFQPAWSVRLRVRGSGAD